MVPSLFRDTPSCLFPCPSRWEGKGLHLCRLGPTELRPESRSTSSPFSLTVHVFGPPWLLGCTWYLPVTPSSVPTHPTCTLESGSQCTGNYRHDGTKQDTQDCKWAVKIWYKHPGLSDPLTSLGPTTRSEIRIYGRRRIFVRTNLSIRGTWGWNLCAPFLVSESETTVVRDGATREGPFRHSDNTEYPIPRWIWNNVTKDKVRHKRYYRRE